MFLATVAQDHADYPCYIAICKRLFGDFDNKINKRIIREIRGNTRYVSGHICFSYHRASISIRQTHASSSETFLCYRFHGLSFASLICTRVSCNPAMTSCNEDDFLHDHPLGDCRVSESARHTVSQYVFVHDRMSSQQSRSLSIQSAKNSECLFSINCFGCFPVACLYEDSIVFSRASTFT